MKREVDQEVAMWLRELGLAVSAMLANSDRISTAITALEHAGHHVFVSFEAVLGDSIGPAHPVSVADEQTHSHAGTLTLSPTDDQFLGSLGIAANS